MSNISQKNVEQRKELFTLILSRKTDKELAHLCRRSSGLCTIYVVCPDAEEGPCPLKAMCGDVDESHWSEVRAMVEKKEDNKLESVEHENQREVLAPFPLIDSSFLDEGIDSYKYLFEENLVEDLAKQCNNNKILYGYSTCPLVNKDVGCPFGDNKLCSEITADDWDKLKLYVKEKEEVNMQREANIQREAHTQENNTQEDIAQETKESPVRCYYAFMVKEEKIVFLQRRFYATQDCTCGVYL